MGPTAWLDRFDARDVPRGRGGQSHGGAWAQVIVRGHARSVWLGQLGPGDRSLIHHHR
jgi:hypothetical protein